MLSSGTNQSDPIRHRSAPPADPTYVCPTDRSELHRSPTGFACTACGQTFEVTDHGIALLDVVRSAEAEAFDEQHRDYGAMGMAEVEASCRLAAAFLRLGRFDHGRSHRILDVACGKGELTVGLALHEAADEAEIYAFDHSVASLSALVRTIRAHPSRAAVHVSAQDATRLAFPADFFDLICGNAVLHHFLDWRQFLVSIRPLLRGGSRAVFAEPFLEGYGIAMAVLELTAASLGLSEQAKRGPEFGLLSFILDNVGSRIRRADEPEFLATLTDKHFFSIDRVSELAAESGYVVSFENYERPEYYAGFMADILKCYGIVHPEFLRAAEEQFAVLRRFFGAEFGRAFSHFRFIMLERLD